MPGNTRQPGSTVAGKLLAVLAAFDTDHRALTLSDIAVRADLALSTAHRQVGALVAWGALVRRDDGAYVVGRRLWDLGLLAPGQAGLRQTASPFLLDLYGATLATVHLAERDGLEVLYLDRVSGHASVPVVSQIGSRLPLHTTGVGKVLLAFAPSAVQQRVLRTLVPVTPYSISQPGLLAEELRRVLRDGFATTREEMSLGACSVAVPVRSPEGTVAAALGLVVPSLRRDRARLVSALQVAARGIERSWAASEVPVSGRVPSPSSPA